MTDGVPGAPAAPTRKGKSRAVPLQSSSELTASGQALGSQSSQATQSNVGSNITSQTIGSTSTQGSEVQPQSQALEPGSMHVPQGLSRGVRK